jgi:tetratricopeptide (TPR) repeat protein
MLFLALGSKIQVCSSWVRPPVQFHMSGGSFRFYLISAHTSQFFINWLVEDNCMNRIKRVTLLFFLFCTLAAQSQDVLEASKKKIAAGDFGGAKADLTKFISANSKNKVAFSLSGQARLGLEDFYGAIGDFTYALEIDSTFSEAWNHRGSAKVALGDDEGAILDFDKAIKFNSKYTEAYSNRGFAKYNIEDLQGAYFDFSKALELGPARRG